jgi:hypothetical protein
MTATPPPFDDLARQLAAAATAGLGPAEAEWAEISLREVILPSVWDRDAPEAEQVGSLLQLRADLEGTSADERWADLVVTHYRSLLVPLQISAFLLALKAHQGTEEDRGWLLIEAGGALAMIQALAEEIEENAAPALELLQDDIDGAILDCEFVRNGPMCMSPHMAWALAQAAGHDEGSSAAPPTA